MSSDDGKPTRDPWTYSGWDGHEFVRGERVCAKCEYWMRYEETIEGDCRRHAPRATSAFDEANLQVRIWRADASEQMETTEVARAVFWPTTANYDWCGEFAARIGMGRQMPRLTSSTASAIAGGCRRRT